MDMRARRLARIVEELAAMLTDSITDQEAAYAARADAGADADAGPVPAGGWKAKYAQWAREAADPTGGDVTACRVVLGSGERCLETLDEYGACPNPDHHEEDTGPWRRIETVELPVGDDPTNTNPADEGTYAIPGPPTMDRKVRDRFGLVWLHRTDDLFAYVPGEGDRLDKPVSVAGGLYEEDPVSGELTWLFDWPSLLVDRGPMQLVPLTEHERWEATMYGPPGARWGDLSKTCPFYGCAFAWGHIPPHKDFDGNPLGETVADGTTVNASITPQAAAEEPCTCGHPERHRPDCVRYERMSGPIPPDAERAVADLAPPWEA